MLLKFLLFTRNNLHFIIKCVINVIYYATTAVRDALLHSWRGYEKYAWGQDDLIPIGKSGRNWLQQAGTMIDALDTLWIMGFKDEFNKVRTI